ncbi:carboxypeptidase regulatory-like domain-containing protein [Sutcliffiella halmapala]|uniref:carboxypeptidase regulatory-like domain-containing protein n=1 Tax=Sutcliffiella halmapala TaxID=79882 RepID=UPI0009953F1E|nr:carboxypeptidase regulatory-like domain-containing protein [Sutcliffiella halmapala]
MIRGLRKSRKRIFSSFFILLLFVSSFIPQTAFAYDEASESDLTFLESEFEKERELEYREKELLEEDVPLEEGELASILSGLGWEPPPLEEEETIEFTENKKVEKAIVEELKENETVDIIVRLKEKQDLNALYTNVKVKKKRTERAKVVKEELQKHAEVAQKGIEKAVATLEEKGSATKNATLWVINGLSLTVDASALEELQKREDVETITLDRVIELPEVIVENTKPRLPEWGLEKIQATKVWGEYGLKGEGIVVGIMDTGVDGSHEALVHNYRGKDGDHQYSWVDLSGQNYATPSDGNGHGTHVAGTAVGGGAGEPIGVAPDAEWIAAKIFTDGGAATSSAIHQAFQWFLAPGGDPSKAPHVVNNSWGSANTYNLEFYEDVQAWIAAGIFPLFAAGNDGPGSQTIGSPGSFPDSFAIGATDSNDQIAPFSSRGPVFWADEEGNQVRYLKPDISAPGHQIYSSWPSVRGAGKYNTISGTSMATPHVAGAIALLLQANPNLSINGVKELLKNTARVEPHMGTLPNDLYGTGIVNIYQAVTEAAYAGQIVGSVQTDDGEDVPVTIQIPSQGIRVEVMEGNIDLSIREGTHKVTIEAFGYESLEVEITVKKGESTEVNWTLKSSDRFQIKGKVIDQDSGEHIPFAYIHLKNTPLSTERSDASGGFVLAQVPNGTFELVVTGEGITGLTQEVEVTGNMEVSLEVERKASAELENWTTANNNYQRNAISPYAIDVNSLSTQWEYVNGTKGQILFSTPSSTEQFVVFTTDRGWVTTLDTGTGEELWSIRIGGMNRSTPTIADDTIYLSGGQDGNIYALDSTNGNVKWSKDIGQPAVYESPLYRNGVLYVGSGLVENPSIYALDASNGATLWSTPLGGASFFGGTLGDHYLYIGSYDNRTLKALHVEDGTEAWSIQLTNEGFASRPVYQNGTVFVQSTNFANGTGTLHALNGSTGEVLWEKAGVGDSQAASPIVFEDLVIASSSTQPILRAFEKETGEEVWSNRSVGTSLNNGSVTANGVLFFAGTSGMLHAMDVYSGSILKEFTLPDYSTSGVVVIAGNVLVPHRSGLISYKAPGILEGTILDKDGKPLPAKVSVMETKAEAETFEDGSFSFSHNPGDFTLKVASYGKKQVVQPIKFVSGFKEKRDFELEDADVGSLHITVQDERSKQALPDVEVRVKDTPLQGISNENGFISYEEIFEGTYHIEFTLNGYKKVNQEVTIQPSETITLEVSMQPFDIAVLNDWESEVTTLLNRNGFLAEERDWDLVEDINRYEVVYLNGAYGSEGWRPNPALFDELLEKAEEHDVSLVFADSWGGNYGSIHHLVEYTDDPKELAHYYGSGQVRIQVEEVHPILEGFNKGDRVTLFTRTGDFSWFNNYSGRHLASIGSTTQGMMGSGVAYKAVSENSAHLLLANHGASPWISPLQGWLPEMQTILFNGIRFLQNTNFGEIVGTVVDVEGNPVQAELGIVETNISTKTSGDNSSFQLFHDEGEYTLEIRASGYATQTEQVVIEHGSPTEVQVVLNSTNGDRIAGLVTDGITKQPQASAVVQMIKDNEIIVEHETPANGRFEFTNLVYGTYTLRIEKEGYIQVNQTIEVGREQDEMLLEIFPIPRVAVLGDYSSSDRNFQATMGEAGITVTSLSIANVEEEIGNYDVLFVNELSNTTFSKKLFDSMMEKADAAQTSVIFGDSFGAGSGIGQLVRLREDPKVRRTVTNTTKSSGYIVEEEHPFFKGREVGDYTDVLLPTGGRLGVFENYSGYTLASVTHEGNEEPHGLGIAYKPRTAGSMELLMSAHGFGALRHNGHYTQEGKKLLVDAVMWAANVQFNTITGVILDEEGIPLNATITVEGEPFQATTNPESGEFSISILDGEYELTIESFGYESIAVPVQVNASLEPFSIELEVTTTVGSVSGIVENEHDGTSVTDVEVRVLGFPRETLSVSQGRFTLERLLPGSYALQFTKEGFVQKQVTVEVDDNEEVELNVKMKPSPTIGVIVDSTASGTVTMKEYLEGRGYQVDYMYYTDLDRLDKVDLVIANSDYDPSKIPTSAEFKAFQKALDQTETSIIWTGQHGARGSIRFLTQFDGNPTVELGGSTAGAQGMVTSSHPIVEGVLMNEAFPVTNRSNYHYAFDGYNGVSVADLLNSSGERLGSMIALNGRTANSVEILLANFTFSHSFHPGEPEYFDPIRERIFNNAILWALDNEEALVGELRGKVQNEQDMPVQARLTVEETGETVETNQQGEFYLGLPSGTFTLAIEAFGHLADEFTVEITNGEIKNETFILSTDQVGVLTNTVKNAQSDELIEGATISILGTPISGTTDENGQFKTVVPVGTYTIRVSAPGYATVVQNQVTVEEAGDVDVTFLLEQSEKIAVVATSANGNRMMNLLDQRGYEADLHINNNLQPLLDNLGDYALIIFNDKHSSMNNAQFEAFIEQADQQQVSIIFASQFSGGTIRDLSEITGNPSAVRWNYVNSQVQVKVLQDHPIFAGFKSEYITILSNGTSSQQYNIYEGYSGTTIGAMSHPEIGVLGEGIGFEFRTANSVHLLLSSLQAGTYGHPESRWTEEAKQLYFNAIDWAISASLGEITGTVRNEEGKGIANAKVQINSLGIETRTNTLGQYRIGVATGSYEVKVTAYGYEAQVQTVEVPQLWDAVVADFELVKMAGVTLSTKLVDKQTEEAIPNAKVTLSSLDNSGLSEEGVSNEHGVIEFSDLIAGEYALSVELDGYLNHTENVTLVDENVDLTLLLNPIQVAVLGDWNNSITSFLNEEELFAESRGWDVIEDLSLYELVVVNSNKGTKEQMQNLLEVADEQEVSLVFVGTWGVNEGSIPLLETVLGYPKLHHQGYNEGSVSLQVVEDHPIFEGIVPNEEGQITILAEKSPYSTFKDYPGQIIGNVHVNGDEKGAAIAYEFKGKNHMHLLMSSFAVNNMVGPASGWTIDGKRVFVQALQFAMNAELPLPNAPVWDEELIRTDERLITVTGRGEVGTTVLIYEQKGTVNTLLTSVVVESDGGFSVEVTLKSGSHFLLAQAKNEAGVSEWSETLRVIIIGESLGNPGIPRVPEEPLKPRSPEDSGKPMVQREVRIDETALSSVVKLEVSATSEGVRLVWKDIGAEYYEVLKEGVVFGKVKDGTSFLDEKPEHEGEVAAYQIIGYKDGMMIGSSGVEKITVKID